MPSTYQIHVGSGSGSLAQDAAETIRAPSLDESSRLAPNETCAFLADAPPEFPNCRFVRSCTSCLQKNGCMIDPSGMCSDPLSNGFDYKRHYLYASSYQLKSSSLQRWYFPADVANYCPQNDATCRECRENKFWLGDRPADSRFCVGAGGCVCVANCYDPATTNSSVMLVCSDQPSSAFAPATAEQNVSFLVQILAMGVGALVICAFIIMYRLSRAKRIRLEREADLNRERRDARQALLEQRRRQRSNELGVGELSLSGWQKYRQDLSNKEELMLSGKLDHIENGTSEVDSHYHVVAENGTTEGADEDRRS